MFFVFVYDDSGNTVVSRNFGSVKKAEEYAEDINYRKAASAGLYTVRIYDGSNRKEPLEEYLLI